jgi:hypothetical protein
MAVCDTVGIVTSRLVSVALRSEPPGVRHETEVEKPTCSGPKIVPISPVRMRSATGLPPIDTR